MPISCRALLVATTLSVNVLTPGPGQAGFPPEQCYVTCGPGRRTITRGPSFEGATVIYREPRLDWLIHPFAHADATAVTQASRDL